MEKRIFHRTSSALTLHYLNDTCLLGLLTFAGVKGRSFIRSKSPSEKGKKWCAGREREDNLECWVAMTTEAFARQLLDEAPLTKDGAYVAQSQQYLSELAPRIWDALWGLLQPFSSGVTQLD